MGEKRILCFIAGVIAMLGGSELYGQGGGYTPTKENLESREEFSNARFGIFLHWGIYSMFAQGEWYLQNYPIDKYEYAKAADAFYPHRFDAREWVSAIKSSGAKYICFTSRHHDGFSMWDSDESEFNVVDATPFGRDVIGELSRECHRQGMRLHLYYSHIDWMRDDYPMGRTATNVIGRDRSKEDWQGYYQFMNRQLKELLTRYGEIGAIWFDGYWDRDRDSVPFNWQLEEQYAMIHRLQPRCLVGNNHHVEPHAGEDIQIFERDLPGENLAGLSGQRISRLPLETCQTMNGMWGYKLVDQNYKSVTTLIRYLVSTAGKGANLLLNIGPQANGELPQAALERLKGIGEWMAKNGDTIYGTEAGDIAPQEWGASTRKGDRLFIHIFELKRSELELELECEVLEARAYKDGERIRFERVDGGVKLLFDEPIDSVDYIVELKTR